MQFDLEVKECNKGKGLFSKEFIPKGSLIWSYNPNVNCLIFTNQYDYINHLQTVKCKYDFIEHTYIVNNTIVYILDNGKYFNHSDSPNCRLGISSQNECCYSTYAREDINPGDELCDDYNTYDDPIWFNSLMDSVNLDHDYY